MAEEPEHAELSEGVAETTEAPNASSRSAGSVKWFNTSKGFGFITPDEGGNDLFVHQTSIQADGFRSLREGELVEFELETAEDGRTKAIKVTGPNGQPPQGAPRRVFVQPVPPMQPIYVNEQPMYVVPVAGPGGPIMSGGMGPGGPGRGRGGFGGRGRGRLLPNAERRPPPGTPGVSSGLQVVVHNLPWSCTWQMLKDHFSNQNGLERADVIIDNDGRSRGFGTVRFTTEEDALAAIEAVNNSQIGGRVISVRVDRFA